MNDDQVCPNIVTSDEGTSYCAFAEAAVRERDQYIADSDTALERAQREVEGLRADLATVRTDVALLLRFSSAASIDNDYFEEWLAARDRIRAWLASVASTPTTEDEQ